MNFVRFFFFNIKPSGIGEIDDQLAVKMRAKERKNSKRKTTHKSLRTMNGANYEE